MRKIGTEISVDNSEYKQLVAIKDRLEKDLIKTQKVLTLLDNEIAKSKEIIGDDIIEKALENELKYELIVKYLGIKNERLNLNV